MKIGLELIKKLKPAIFRYKTKEDNRRHIGFIARDIEEILPSEEFAIIKIDSNNQYVVDGEQLIAPLVKSVQELNNKVEKLEERLNAISIQNSKESINL